MILDEIQNYSRKGMSEYVAKNNGIVIKIDGIRGEFADGWFIARKSGTEEALSYRIESKTESGFSNLKRDVLEIINNR